ncbi:kinase [Streptomyces sp. SL13]|uniref:Kinase n=1 Tax=Streptantibioticus silvisoli TaxID=2705255 RepID=A0AA90H3X0_9ACTN|nr:kinase [Streptantibioticus silvisoli]MDI5968345.1 kinase [Streptantibioticus silvisoli]
MTQAVDGVAASPGPPYRAVTGVGTAFGTFGELLQGVLPGDDGDFLVTLPIACWARATFRPAPHGAALEVRPAHKTKALRLTRLVMESSRRPAGGLLTLESRLPEGKGLASSSADLVATARALGDALGEPMPPRRIESYLAGIEPTDGVLYPGIVAYHHRRVALRALLGPLPSMTVVGCDEGGAVDTVEFNRVPKPFSAADRRAYAVLLERMTVAVARTDLAEVGAVATRSALMNQVLRPKRTLDAMIAVCREVGGLGVVVGHSGTSLGVLLDRREPSYPRRLLDTASACSQLLGEVTVHRTLGFGR